MGATFFSNLREKRFLKNDTNVVLAFIKNF